MRTPTHPLYFPLFGIVIDFFFSLKSWFVQTDHLICLMVKWSVCANASHQSHQEKKHRALKSQRMSELCWAYPSGMRNSCTNSRLTAMSAVRQTKSGASFWARQLAPAAPAPGVLRDVCQAGPHDGHGHLFRGTDRLRGVGVRGLLPEVGVHRAQGLPSTWSHRSTSFWSVLLRPPTPLLGGWRPPGSF